MLGDYEEGEVWEDISYAMDGIWGLHFRWAP